MLSTDLPDIMGPFLMGHAGRAETSSQALASVPSCGSADVHGSPSALCHIGLHSGRFPPGSGSPGRTTRRTFPDYASRFHSQVQRHGTQMLPGPNASTPQQGISIIRDYRWRLIRHPTRPSSALACGSGWRPPLLAARRYRPLSCLWGHPLELGPGGGRRPGNSGHRP